jgi:hypothetical protein
MNRFEKLSAMQTGTTVTMKAKARRWVQSDAGTLLTTA